MRRLGAALALVVLMAGCEATDEPYVPPSTESDGTAASPGPTNPEIFSAIERAESAVGGRATAVDTRLQSYTVTVVADGVLNEVTVVGSGIITNTVRELDADEFSGAQVVTLADAVDAAAIAYPGRVDSAAINLDDEIYDVVIEYEGELITVAVDAVSAEVIE